MVIGYLVHVLFVQANGSITFVVHKFGNGSAHRVIIWKESDPVYNDLNPEHLYCADHLQAANHLTYLIGQNLMPTSLNCPNCSASLDFSNNKNDVSVHCDYCNSTLIVPEEFRAKHASENPFNHVQQSQAMQQIVLLVQNGRKIEAIRLFRESFNVGLREAKQVIDSLERQETVHFNHETFTSRLTTSQPRPSSSNSSGCVGLILFFMLVGLGLFWLNGGIDGLNADTIDETISRIETVVQNPEASAAELDEVIGEVERAVEGLGSETAVYPHITLRFGKEGIGPGFFNDTRLLDIDGAGRIYTGDYEGGRIQIFEPDGTFLRQINVGESNYLTSMVVDDKGVIYISTPQGVERFSGESGTSLGMLPQTEGNYFRTLASGPNGEIVALNETRMLRFDALGSVTLDVAQPFASVDSFQMIFTDATVDYDGNIYVLGKEAIYKFNKDGQLVDQIGSRGEAEDQFFTFPSSITVDGRSNIYAYDFSGILLFDENGRFLQRIPSPGIAFDMAVTADDQLLIMDRNSNEVRQYNLSTLLDG